MNIIVGLILVYFAWHAFLFTLGAITAGVVTLRENRQTWIPTDYVFVAVVVVLCIIGALL